MDTYFSLHTTYITSQYNQVVLPSPSLPQSIGSKYWYKVMMILLLCMVNESWCLDVHMYPIHIPYRKRKRDRQAANQPSTGLIQEGGFFFLGYAFVQLLCKVVRLLIMMLENQDAVLTTTPTTTSKYYQGQTSSPPAVFLYLSSSINVVRSIPHSLKIKLVT